MVNGVLRQTSDDGLGAFSVIVGVLWTGLQRVAANSLVLVKKNVATSAQIIRRIRMSSNDSAAAWCSPEKTALKQRRYHITSLNPGD
jgi:hypothetical protein